jgi:hypothetical protein
VTVESVCGLKFFGFFLERTNQLRAENGAHGLERDLLVAAARREERFVNCSLLEQLGETVTVVEAAAGSMVGLGDLIAANDTIGRGSEAGFEPQR